MFKTVVFDLDGTLLNTLGDLAAACNHALNGLGLPIHAENDYRHMVGNGLPKLIERILPEANRDEGTMLLARSMFESYYSQHIMDLTTPYPGIPQLLKELSAAGVAMGVVSNKDNAFTQQIVGKFFPNTFSMVLGQSKEFLPKPNPASLVHVIEHIGCELCDTLYVGDSDVDMMTARGAGVVGCGVLWGFRTQDELIRAGASYIAADPSYIKTLALQP